MYVYPRLSLFHADSIYAELKSAYEETAFSALSDFAGVDHPNASPVATGGRAADISRISTVRESVLADLQPLLRDSREVSRTRVSDFDRVLGKSLHRNLEIVPSDAAHDEVWNFLTLVVFPDIAVSRFPDMHKDRMLGSNRNVLRRTWFRYEVLGDLLEGFPRPLGEDELVGMFERTALARNRPLLRALVPIVAQYDGPGSRSDWARLVYKRITFITGPRLLDVTDSLQINDVVIEAVQSISSP